MILKKVAARGYLNGKTYQKGSKVAFPQVQVLSDLIFREKGFFIPPPSFPFIICGPKKWVGKKRVFGQPEKNMGEEGSSQDGHIGQSALGPAPPPNFLGNVNEGILNSFPGCCTRGALALGKEEGRLPFLPFRFKAYIQDDTTSVLPISCFQPVYTAPLFAYIMSCREITLSYWPWLYT